MSERKVLNKYYPPDFDPSKIPRRKQPKNLQMKVRMMLPMSIRCDTCGNYIYKGTKFNCRKEDVEGERYLGILIFRFYFKCTRCSAELIMKTDPQNSDYLMESGATRNFEPWRNVDEAKDSAKRKREAEEMGDAMKALENRTLDNKQEMDIIAALDEMKSMRARQATVDPNDLIKVLQSTSEKSEVLAEEDEALIRSLVFKNSSQFVQRIDDEEEELEEESFKSKKSHTEGFVEDASLSVNTNAESSKSEGKNEQIQENNRVEAKPFAKKPFIVKPIVKPKIIGVAKPKSNDKNIENDHKMSIESEINKVETNANSLASILSYADDDDEDDD